MVLLLRLIYGLWFVGMLGLLLLTLAYAVFGGGSFSQRLRALPLRVALAVVWPLASMTRRGRELLSSIWRSVR